MDALPQQQIFRRNTQDRWQRSSPADALNESLRPSCWELKKAVRILKDLSRDALRRYPHLPLPSSWFIRSLALTHYCTAPDGDWRQAMIWTLTYIKQCSCPSNRFADSFVQPDGTTPLFPNSDQFTLADTHLYAKTLLCYLNAQAAM